MKYDPITYRKAMRQALDNEFLTEEWEIRQCATAMYYALMWSLPPREKRHSDDIPLFEIL
jgi:hypothetical protein